MSPLTVLLALFLSTKSAAPRAVIKLETYRDTIAMHANVGGKDGYFVFDTGSGVTTITPQFAQKIGCEPWGRLTGFAMKANRIDAPRCSDVSITVGGERSRVPDAGVLDVMAFYPKDAAPIDGLISLGAFEGKAITIDFPANTLTVESPSSLKQRVRGATEVPMRSVREVQGLSLTIVAGVPTAKGHVWMELDTGNSRTILINKAYASLFGLDPANKEPQPVDFKLAGDLRVGGKAFATDIIIDGNIGMPFLKDIVMTIDFASGRMWMKR